MREQFGQAKWRWILTIAIGVSSLPGIAARAQGPVRTVEIHAEKFKFNPAEITLKKGETVKLVFISEDVPHGIAVNDLPIHQDFEKGHPAIVTVTPDKVGDFAGRCSKFCGAGHRDMHFMVHVVN